MKQINQLHQLHALGFDRSYRTIPPEPWCLLVVCSACVASVINGTPYHETGCPHARTATPADKKNPCR